MLEQLKSQHESVYDEIVTNNQYRVKQEDLKDKNIIDIGANNGLFSLLSKHYGANKVIAVESNPDAYSLLTSNLIPGIHAIHAAATGKVSEKVDIVRASDFKIDGRNYTKPGTQIDTVPLDILIDGFDDKEIVLKIDCEGSEYEILYNSKLLAKCQTILIEMHQKMGAAETNKIDELRKFIIRTGFKETWSYDYIENVKIARYDLEPLDITVIITEYLRPELLEEQIACFQNQTIKPKRILIWQTQVGPENYDNINIIKQPNVFVIHTNHDFGLTSRFCIPLLAKTDYVCLVDDDIFPGSKWLETCLAISREKNSVVSAFGIRYKDNCNDLSSDQFGDNGTKSNKPERVDMGGHSWFGKKDWFALFNTESIENDKIADDIHFAHVLKINNIDTYVSPYPEDNKEIWGNTKPEIGMGVRALHTRDFNDEKVWKDTTKRGWGGQSGDYLAKNLKSFCKEREEIVKKYQARITKDTNPPITIGPPQQSLSNQTRDRFDITAVVCTKDRYFSTLPATLMAIAQQTYKPKEIIILDDSEEFKPVGQSEPMYKTIFDYFMSQSIMWYHIPGRKQGQVANHIKSVELAKTDFIWRVDDDEIPENDVLEILVNNIADDVGAVAGLVLPANDIKLKPDIIQNKIEDIYLGYNEQWYIHKDDSSKEVDHLYSSFIYRKSIAEYNTDLSPVCHREETMLTYQMKLKGYKLIIDPSAKTIHYRNPTGGIRSSNDPAMYASDERVFANKLKEWNVTPTEFAHVVLNNGIGDHYVFKNLLPEYLEQNKNKKVILYTSFPEVFGDIPQSSIADAITLFGKLDKFDTYKLMWDFDFKGSLSDAFRKVYHLNQSNIKTNFVLKNYKQGIGDYVVISPYSQNPTHQKSYPYWNELIKLLDCKIIQIGRIGEQPLEGTELKLGLKFTEIEELLTNCNYWISPDNFLQHLNHSMEEPVKGAVIFAESDPLLFGYPQNINILKSRKFLRPRQFDKWYADTIRHDEYFLKPKELVPMLNFKQPEPTVSIIIPCYKQAEFLEDAIISCLDQTVLPKEIIVINDGSPDNTSEIAKRHPVTLIETTNNGLSAARNIGIKTSTGTHIICLDADDTLDSQFIEKLTKITADIVCPTLKEFGDSNNVWKPPLQNPKFEDFMRSNKIFCAALFKRIIWENIGGYDENLKHGYEDWDFWIRATKAGFKVSTTTDILFNYRKHGHSMVSDAKLHHAENVAYIVRKNRPCQTK